MIEGRKRNEKRDMNDPIIPKYDRDWHEKLRQRVMQSVQENYEGRWAYSLIGDKGLAIDISFISGPFEITRIEYAEEQQELLIYLTISPEVRRVYDVHRAVHRALCQADEEYFVFIPLHTANELQFWFMIGGKSHGHIGRMIVLRSENPHIEYGEDF